MIVTHVSYIFKNVICVNYLIIKNIYIKIIKIFSLKFNYKYYLIVSLLLLLFYYINLGSSKLLIKINKYYYYYYYYYYILY